MWTFGDQGGLMLGRQAFLESIKNNTCSVMIRELVPGSLASCLACP